MTGRAGPGERTVLLMWEYSCAHSPVWARSPDLPVGPIDVRALGVGDDLRDDLAAWNEAVEVAADPSGLLPAPTPAAEWRALQTAAFPLAARLQRALGDDWTVWCLSGDGDGGLREAGGAVERRFEGADPVLLEDGGPVTWRPSGAVPALGRFDAALMDALWCRPGDLAPGERRARALELAGRLHAALPTGRVLWFGGGSVP